MCVLLYFGSHIHLYLNLCCIGFHFVLQNQTLISQKKENGVQVSRTCVSHAFAQARAEVWQAAGDCADQEARQRLDPTPYFAKTNQTHVTGRKQSDHPNGSPQVS